MPTPYERIRSGETITQELENSIVSIYRDNDFIVFKYDFREDQPAFFHRIPLKKLDEIEARQKIRHWTIANNQMPVN